MNFPEKCPYCGKDVKSNIANSIVADKTSDFAYACELHYCEHCEEPIFVISKKTYGSRIEDSHVVQKSEIVQVFPPNMCAGYPESVKELSPNAYKAFSQACQARDMGQDMLVGAGLRIALEWLVWDYLITVKNFNKEELEHLKLSQRAEKMKTHVYTKVCADIIRHFGNDEVHVVKLFDFSIDEGFEIYTILCDLIDAELKIINANQKLSQRHS